MDETTIKTYDILAREYDKETSEFWEKFPNSIINEFSKNIPNGGRVLDIGSGPGRDALILKKRGLDVLCLDASQAMIDICKERGLETIKSDFLKMPIENNSFDGVWAYTSLLHIKKEEVDKALNEIKRVLKEGGILGLGFIEGNKECYRESSEIKKLRWFSFYTKNELDNLIEKNGFEILYFDTFKPGSKMYLNYVVRKIEN